MFAIISGSNSLNLTNLLASDTHHQFHNLWLQMCFPGEALSFFRVSCVQLQLGLHWAFLFPPRQQHGTEERLLNIRHVYSHYSLFTGNTNNCAGAFRRQWKKIIIFACFISRQEQFPGLLQLHQQEQVAGQQQLRQQHWWHPRSVWLPCLFFQIAFPLFRFERDIWSRYWIRASQKKTPWDLVDAKVTW